MLKWRVSRTGDDLQIPDFSSGNSDGNHLSLPPAGRRSSAAVSSLRSPGTFRRASLPPIAAEPAMSHHSDDALLVAGSDSFWEPGNYKRTTRRIEDGFRLCNDLTQLIQERGEIEKGYAKSLKTWAKKWNELIEKGPEYGTTEAAWKGVLVEADRISELHVNVRDQLTNRVQNEIKQWQKDAYHKSMMQQIKEKKEMDDLFKKAQKPWAKFLAKVNKSKADYHAACKNEKTSMNQERNAAADSAISPDQHRKLQERAQKCKEEVQKGKEKYEESLLDINAYNPKYIEDMTQVFEKCQEMEERRLKFFKDMLFKIQECLDISNDPTLPKIYEEYRYTIQNADSSKDLKWWSNNHGVAMAMNWPLFEDYSEEFRDIASVKSKRSAVAESSITLLNQRIVSDELPEYNPEGKKEAAKSSVNHKNEANQQNKHKAQGNQAISNGKANENPFEEDNDNEEWEEYPNDALVDNGEPGVPVRALYDYEGAESDELTFKQGELFEKLEDEDEQGWCKGRKDGRVGLYPANYVENV